ncbi:MAG: calycin-like domain-containing protein [Prevotellaceae bacterium]|jgi:hypothetical protein|nr:calycin-like domain-containing protein [Prevotellaceae bacterium]
MKVISKLLMFTLVLSVFAGCKKEDENLPLKDVAGTYVGTLNVSIEENPIENVSIVVNYNSGNTASIRIPNGSISAVPVDIDATCNITSDKSKYSLSGTASISIPQMGELSVTIANDSYIDKSGKAFFNMTAEGLGMSMAITIEFNGQKRN